IAWSGIARLGDTAEALNGRDCGSQLASTRQGARRFTLRRLIWWFSPPVRTVGAPGPPLAGERLCVKAGKTIAVEGLLPLRQLFGGQLIARGCLADAEFPGSDCEDNRSFRPSTPSPMHTRRGQEADEVDGGLIVATAAHLSQKRQNGGDVVAKN